jgi:hypothetical protein
LLSREDAGIAGSSWSALGFVLSETQWNGESIVVVDGANSDAHDPGRYYVRRTPAMPVLLQAPHVLNDRLTGDLVLALMREAPFAAAALSTRSRHVADGDGAEFDLAHRADSYFFAMARAFLDTHGNGIIAQFHGFQPESQRSDRAAMASLILSNGTRQPGETVVVLHVCLASAIDGSVLLFPDDVEELGGTRNAVARLIDQSERDEFLHLEMSLELRERLVDDAALRRRIADCLMGTLSG